LSRLFVYVCIALGGVSMKLGSLAIAVLALFLHAPNGGAQSVLRWDFDKVDDSEGWEVRPDARGVVMGGALWLTLITTPKITARPYEGFGDSLRFDGISNPSGNLISSPHGLGISAAEATQVRLRVLNLSPVTDFYLMWRARGGDWGFDQDDGSDQGDVFASLKAPRQSKRCTLQPDLKQWQEVTCVMDRHWQGVIDQIAIRLSEFSLLRGDLWIDWLEISRGPTQPRRPRPDVASVRVVPKIIIPGISQAGFADAFKVLDEALVVDVPVDGFTYPVMGAGGYYGEHWFALDSSIAVTGAQWVNQSFAEGVMRGFRAVQEQNVDGRIDMSGVSRGNPVGDLSQTPRFFEVAYDVARRTNDSALRTEIYDTMRRYLDWWLSPVKRDQNTGLIVASCEDCDTLGELPDWTAPPFVAPVDLNVAVASGAERMARLAAVIGKPEDARRYRQVFQELSRAINAKLWNEMDGVYYNYDLTGGHPRPHLIVSTFDPLRHNIASPAQRDRLIEKLVDPREFNWGEFPLTSMAKGDSAYVEAKGNYTLSAWNGDVWTYRNMEVINGLEESGRPDLAAELNWATIKEFHNNYHEFLLPSTGAGAGTDRYTWSASQYIGAIIEHLFGVDFDALNHQVRVAPHLPKALYGQDVALDNLILPTGPDTRLSVHVNQSSQTAATVHINVSGMLPEGDLLVSLPGTAKETRVSMRRSYTAKFQ
jgi:Trehalase